MTQKLAEQALKACPRQQEKQAVDRTLREAKRPRDGDDGSAAAVKRPHHEAPAKGSKREPVPHFDFREIMEDDHALEELRETLSTFGGAVLRNVLEPEDLRELERKKEEMLKAASPDGKGLCGKKKSIPGGGGCSIAKDCGVPGWKVAFDVRAKVGLPLYKRLYGTPECVTSVDAVFLYKGGDGKTTLEPHYDDSLAKGSPAQDMRRDLREHDAPLGEAVQSVFTVSCSPGVGTRLDLCTLEQDEKTHARICDPLQNTTVRPHSCFRKLGPLGQKTLSEPLGRPNSMVLWVSSKLHGNALGSPGAHRFGFSLACAPAYTRSDKVRREKIKRVDTGGATNHWANRCEKSGSLYSYYNSPHKSPWVLPLKEDATPAQIANGAYRVTGAEVAHLL